MIASLPDLRRVVVSLLVAGCLIAGSVSAANATSLVAAWSMHDAEAGVADEGEESEVSRSVGLMSGAQAGTATLDDIGEGIEVSRSVGLMSAATGDASALQEHGEEALEISRSVGLMDAARGSSDGTTLAESAG